MSMFEQASRAKIRFETPKGSITVEDLWDIPLLASNGQASLDNIARALSARVKDQVTESFVVKPPKADAILELQLEIAKYIIRVRLTELDEAEKAKVRKQQKQKLLALIDVKEQDKLSNLSLSKLREMAEAL